MHCVLIVSWGTTRFAALPGGQTGALGRRARSLHGSTLRYNGRGASPHPAGRHLREGVFAMDSQTVIAVCALLALMVAIADLARKE